MTKTALDIIAKASAIRRSPQFLAKLQTLRANRSKPKAAVRVPSEADKAAARRKVLKQATAKPAAKPKATAAPIDLDNGDRLMQARTRWQSLKVAAHTLARVGTRNLTPLELRFIAAVRALPSRAPNQSNTLREWRSFAASVEAANLKAPATY
jgi:hypothetical protein